MGEYVWRAKAYGVLMAGLLGTACPQTIPMRFDGATQGAIEAAP
jgi:hypothetical protein